MESYLAAEGVTFEKLRARLLLRVKLRIDNGEFTERGLARILGISQSQTHNVLKGVRFLKIQLADRMLAKLGISVVDLLHQHELSGASPLEMAKWDRQADSEMSSALKMPAARSETRSRQEARKTG